MLTLPAESAPADVSERRTATRHPASVISSIAGVHLSPGGGEATLVNISSTGALVRCATKLLPGTPVTLVFDGAFTPASVKGKVVRCLVADIGRPAGLSYHIGIAFNDAILLEEEPIETLQPAEAIQPTASASASVLVNRW